MKVTLTIDTDEPYANQRSLARLLEMSIEELNFNGRDASGEALYVAPPGKKYTAMIELRVSD